MQRIRMSLTYFKDFGWEPEVVTVYPKHADVLKDDLLLESIPKDIVIHYVNAFEKKWTRKFGLGSLALRSIWFYKQKVNSLLKSKKYDLIYFSTTEYTLCTLGPHWKKRFSIPYVIDFQDPWHSNYYLDKPKQDRPSKYWFSYRLNKYLEPIALKKVDGIISVSEAYINTFYDRYPITIDIPSATITFGAFETDFEIAKKHHDSLRSSVLIENENFINIVYAGRGGHDMYDAAKLLFEGFKSGLASDYSFFTKIRFYFIGTSYAPNGSGKKTIQPIANELEVGDYVFEFTDRISLYNSINTFLSANALVILGSNDTEYTASKIFPYILSRKPILALFNEQSSAYQIIKTCNAGTIISLSDTETGITNIVSFLQSLKNPVLKNDTKWDLFETFSARNMTCKQCELFDKVITYAGK